MLMSPECAYQFVSLSANSTARPFWPKKSPAESQKPKCKLQEPQAGKSRPIDGYDEPPLGGAAVNNYYNNSIFSKSTNQLSLEIA